MPISNDRSLLHPAIVIVAAALHVVVCVQWLACYTGTEIAKLRFADDAFYYLEIANHIVAGHGSTFDGTAMTNGYHPLWMVCCCAIAGMMPRDNQVATIVVVQGALVLATGLFLWRALHRVDRLAASLTTALFFSSTSLRVILMNGMECALGLALLAALFWFTMRIPDRRITLQDRTATLVTFALLAGIALSRLEMGLVAASYLVGSWVLAGPGESGRRTRRNTILILAGLAATVLAYIALNTWIAKWPVPISGSVKWGQTEIHEVWLRTAHWHLSAFLSLLCPRVSWRVLAFEIPIALITVAAILRIWIRRPELRSVLMVFGVPTLTFVVVVINRSGGFTWYAWPALFLGVIATFCSMDWLAAFCRGSSPRIVRILSHGIVFGLVAYCVAAPILRMVRPRPELLFDWAKPEPLWDHCAQFLRDSIPPDDVVAGTAVGLLAFATERNIVQLEGLVNDREYMEALRAGKAPEVLRQRGVRWLVAPLSDRRSEQQILGPYYRTEDVEARMWLREVGGFDLDTEDDVAIIRLRKP